MKLWKILLIAAFVAVVTCETPEEENSKDVADKSTPVESDVENNPTTTNDDDDDDTPFEEDQENDETAEMQQKDQEDEQDEEKEEEGEASDPLARRRRRRACRRIIRRCSRRTYRGCFRKRGCVFYKKCRVCRQRGVKRHLGCKRLRRGGRRCRFRCHVKCYNFKRVVRRRG